MASRLFKKRGGETVRRKHECSEKAGRQERKNSIKKSEPGSEPHREKKKKNVSSLKEVYSIGKSIDGKFYRKSLVST